MNEQNNVTMSEIAKNIACLREEAGIKQVDLAKQITWSPTLLSRVESGERDISSDELEKILEAIGSEKAKKLKELINRQWEILPRPPLDHPDQDILWRAEKAGQKLENLRKQPEVPSVFERRLCEYLNELRHCANLILKREHKIAMIGSIGVGKSTFICKIVGLEVSAKNGDAPSPVLEAGGGGITICDVHLKTGQGVGIVVEPRSDEEIRNNVRDFAAHILESYGPDNSDIEKTAHQDSRGISKEIERALRNMADLPVRREKKSDGERSKLHDAARDLAKSFKFERDLEIEILNRMKLHCRDRRDVQYDNKSGEIPYLWLKKKFEQINNGREREFSLPRRIDIVIQENILAMEEIIIEIVDTKGIDNTEIRADLEKHLDDSHTLTLLCSSFNNAPESGIQLLLERAIQVGIGESRLSSKTAIVVLPRSNEALAVKDESGFQVESTEEGYELKGEQVSLALAGLGLRNLQVGFFDAYQDDIQKINGFLVERVRHLRNDFCTRMKEIIENIDFLLENYEQEQFRVVIGKASNQIQAWIKEYSEISPIDDEKTYSSLLSEMRKIHSSTLWATVRREGEWEGLSYSHHLGFGARKCAVIALGEKVTGFSSICKTMIANPDYRDAKDLIRQTERLLLSAYDGLIRKIQLMGNTAFNDQLKGDPEFWKKCNEEWGKGRGFRTNVTSYNASWFGENSRQHIHKQIADAVEKEWKLILERMKGLLVE